TYTLRGTLAKFKTNAYRVCKVTAFLRNYDS
ncbi:hypothetical protein A5885_003351, partial [Enterococcus sp. 8E11_MSG4843]